MISKEVRIIHEATTVNPDPTEFMPIEVNSAFPEGAKSIFNSQEKAQIDKFINEVPDKNDTSAINYWVEWGDREVYLEGWIDKCLIGTGFPPMEGGEWDEKIQYMVRDTHKTLIAKQTDGSLSPPEIVAKLPLTLIEGGFREFEAGEKSWLYGVSWGVYKKDGAPAASTEKKPEIPKTRVSSLGFQELELPVAKAVEALVNENPWSSGFHEALNQRWAIVFRGKISDRAVNAAKVAGLEVSYREAPKGSGQILTDVSLPDVGVTEIEKATEVFNRFAELYEGSIVGKYEYKQQPQAKRAKSYAEGLGYRASLQYRNGKWELTIYSGFDEAAIPKAESGVASSSPLILKQYPIGEVPEKMELDFEIGKLEVPIPPPRGTRVPPKKPKIKVDVPRILTMGDYERDWKPKGWQLLTIGPTSTWRQDWGEWEAIRDIVQNSLDETEAYQWGYDKEGLWISDRGRGVAVADFLLGPPKAKPDWARGKFGEGMKIAALALLRREYSVHVETIGREIWMVFLEQEVNGRAYQLAALWQRNGRPEGTKFHIIGYSGSAYDDMFAVNLPRSSILWKAPSTIKEPKQRFNQLIQHPFPEGSRIFARDIYMRDINSPYSYNLWSFVMAPDRHAPKDETDLWVDMGRLWSTVNKIDLLEIFLQMVKSPPLLESDESHNVNMDNWRMGEVSKGKRYVELIDDNKEVWLKAWHKVMGENAVIRTEDKWDNIMKHLGYQSVSVTVYVRDALSKAIPTDRVIKELSLERLRETAVIPDEKLDSRQLTHLKLARAITKELFPFNPPSRIYAAIIPPASDRVRTAGMYGTTTQAVYISIDQLYRGRNTLDTLVHELAHHRQYRKTGEAEDLTPPHAEAMTYIAAMVVEEVSKRKFDELLKEVLW